MQIRRELSYLGVTSSHHFSSSSEVFSDRANQSLAVQVASAFERLVVLTRHWLSGVPARPGTGASPAELRREVRKLGGCLQLFLQVSDLGLSLGELTCSASVYRRSPVRILPKIRPLGFSEALSVLKSQDCGCWMIDWWHRDFPGLSAPWALQMLTPSVLTAALDVGTGVVTLYQ